LRMFRSDDIQLYKRSEACFGLLRWCNHGVDYFSHEGGMEKHSDVAKVFGSHCGDDRGPALDLTEYFGIGLL
jgi:hypothetical protein